jgi:predicted deacylase
MQITLRKSRLYLGAGLEIDLPYFDISGDGSPRVSILFGVHGDELDTLIFAERIIALAKAGAVNRACRLILISNPLACAEASRVAAIDLIDLNRGFLKARLHPYSSALTGELERLVAGSACVLSLHQFETDSPILAAFYDMGDEAVRSTAWEVIGMLDPEVAVWAAPLQDPTYSAYSDTIEATLMTRGIPAIMIEFSRTILSQPRRLKQFEEGLARLLQNSGGEPPKDPLDSYRGPVFYARHHIYPTDYGIFQPCADLNILDRIEKGQTIGEILSLPDLARKPIISQYAGGVLQIRPPSFVVPAQYVVAVGEQSGPGYET